MTTIEFTGYPLAAPVRLAAIPDEIHPGESHYVDRDAAYILATAWCDAPTHEADGDIARAVDRLDDGTLITALHMCGEVTISVWQPDNDDGSRYSTATAPWDFDLRVID